MASQPDKNCRPNTRIQILIQQNLNKINERLIALSDCGLIYTAPITTKLQKIK